MHSVRSDDDARVARRGAPWSRRVWLFRCLAILLGLSPFIFAEFVLRLVVAPRSISAPRTSIEFESVRPLFVHNEAAGRYEIPPARAPFFKPDSFRATKGPKEFRVFCFGGSTVQGNPYSTPTAFTTWLELSLRAAAPDRDWQVINCGGISYASYRLAPIFEECLGYEPDLMILYLGDNEFLEERHYATLSKIPPWLAPIANLRLIQLVRDLYHRRPSSRERESAETRTIRLSAEVDALLDYRGGLEKYHRDDAWRRGVIDHFRDTLAEMLDASRKAEVPAFLIDPVCNVKDCAPFKVETDANLSEQARERFENLLAVSSENGVTVQQRVDAIRTALDIDPRHAGAWYALGRAYLEAGSDERARQALFRAKDEDVCPLRIIEPLRVELYEAASLFDVPIIPVMGRFAEASPHGIPGDELLLDHLHPSITGHQMIAEQIVETMEERGFVVSRPAWEQERQRLYREHMATLDTPYFARGKEHLEGLRKWAQGRVEKMRPSGK